MALNRGQLYEKQLFEELKKNNKIPENINKIESVDGQDITVFNRNGQSGIEIKSTVSAAFGSGTLKFDYTNKNNPWILLESDVDEDSDESVSKDIMKNIAKKYKIADIVNKEWYKNNGNYLPLYLEENNPKKNKNIISIPRVKRGKQDSEVLHEIKIECNKNDIEKYYTSKGSYYIQINKYGLYWMGVSDPLNISKIVSRFNPSKTIIRVRVQPKGGGKYNFSYGLYIKNLTKSSFSLDNNLNPSWLGYSGNP